MYRFHHRRYWRCQARLIAWWSQSSSGSHTIQAAFGARTVGCGPIRWWGERRGFTMVALHDPTCGEPHSRTRAGRHTYEHPWAMSVCIP